MERELIVRPIQGEERENWDQLMADHHYLGLKHLVGESIRYVALLNGQWVALAFAGPAPLTKAAPGTIGSAGMKTPATSA